MANSDIAATIQRAIAAHQAGNLLEAMPLYEAVLRQDASQFDALHMLGVLQAQRGNFAEAEGLISRALKSDPVPQAYVNHARVLLELKRYDDALEATRAALSRNASDVGAWNFQGCAHLLLKQPELALESLNRALALQPGLPLTHYNRGEALCLLGSADAALEAYNNALAGAPTYVQAWVGRGKALTALKRYDEALAAYAKALSLKPDLAEAWQAQGDLLLELRRYEDAFAAYDKAWSLQPGLPYVQGYRLYSKMHVCEWSNLEAECEHLVAGIRKGLPVSDPLVCLSMPSSSSDRLDCARRFVDDKKLSGQTRLWSGDIYGHDRIRIAYLSADFRDHPVAHLLAGLIEHRDREQFEATAISFGPDDQSEVRARLSGAFDRFIDVRGRSDQAVARQLRDMEIDIAVDLMGFTAQARMPILGWRPAPIQVSYLGYAGTAGAPHFDYVIADRFVVPDDQRQYYSEEVVYLPDTFMATDDKRKIAGRAPTRGEAGLPETGFVFCSLGASYKITPAVFAVWMQLLRGVDGSVLWLASANNGVATNLRREAQRHGVDGNRLVFASRVKLPEEHLARYRLADLFLDTVPYNAHATACDALWGGVPVLTCAGSTFAARVAGSLLHAVGLPELIAGSLDEYQALALKLAREPERLRSLKEKLNANQKTYPLFNTDRFTRNIEAAYRRMVERQRKGQPPESFAVGGGGEP